MGSAADHLRLFAITTVTDTYARVDDMSNRVNSFSDLRPVGGCRRGSGRKGAQGGGDEGEEEGCLEKTGRGVGLDFHGRLVADEVLNASHTARKLISARVSI